MDALSDVWFTLARRFRISLREPVWIFFSLAQPLIWLLLFTQLFKNLALMPGFPTSEYLLFFAPGLIVMMAVFSSAYTGFDMLQDIQYGVVDKMLITPANRYALIIGNILNALTSLTIQILIIFVMVYLMGVSAATGAGGIVLTLVIVWLIGLAFCSLSYALIIATRSQTALVVIANLLSLPLMFLSSAMMPAELVPDWVQTAMMFNPVNYAVEAVRPLFISGYDWSSYGMGLLVLGIFAVVGVVTAVLAFRNFGK
jgi:ABC-2 type transport system permease protein